MKVPFLDLQAMHNEIMDGALAAMERVARKNNFVLGDEVDYFEQEFAAYSGTKYAVGVDSGLSALKLAMEAYDLGPGDEALVPANTFIATAAAAVFIGVKPVFVEPKPGTYNIDVDQLEAALTPNTKAIVPVHLYGTPADMDPILEFADKHNLVVVEDASQAHGARYKGKRVGGLGHIAGFSLYPGKNLGAFGQGGIITTNDAAIADKLRALRNCGQMEKYVHIYAPHNSRLDTIQAAVLRLKLARLDVWNDRRRQVAAWYDEALIDAHVITPLTPEWAEPVWHLYVVRTPHRDALQKFLGEKGIGTGIHYPIPIHMSPVYKDMGYQEGDFPITEREANEILSLPMFPHMTREHVEYVAAAIKEFEREAVPQPSV